MRDLRRVGVEGGRPGGLPGQRVGQGGQAPVRPEPLADSAAVPILGLALAEYPEVDTSVARILIGFPIPISQGKIQCPSFQLMISNFSSLISHFQFLISHSLFLPSHFQLLVSHFM